MRRTRRRVGCCLDEKGVWCAITGSGMLLLKEPPHPAAAPAAACGLQGAPRGGIRSPARQPARGCAARGTSPAAHPPGHTRQRPSPRPPAPTATAHRVSAARCQPVPASLSPPPAGCRVGSGHATAIQYPRRGGDSHPHRTDGGSAPRCPPQSLAGGAVGAPSPLRPPAPVLSVFPWPNNGRGGGCQHAPAAGRIPTGQRRASAGRPPSTERARPGVRGVPPSRWAWRHRRQSCVGRPAARAAAVPPTPAPRSAALVGCARGRHPRSSSQTDTPKPPPDSRPSTPPREPPTTVLFPSAPTCARLPRPRWSAVAVTHAACVGSGEEPHDRGGVPASPLGARGGGANTAGRAGQRWAPSWATTPRPWRGGGSLRSPNHEPSGGDACPRRQGGAKKGEGGVGVVDGGRSAAGTDPLLLCCLPRRPDAGVWGRRRAAVGHPPDPIVGARRVGRPPRAVPGNFPAHSPLAVRGGRLGGVCRRRGHRAGGRCGEEWLRGAPCPPQRGRDGRGAAASARKKSSHDGSVAGGGGALMTAAAANGHRGAVGAAAPRPPLPPSRSAGGLDRGNTELIRRPPPSAPDQQAGRCGGGGAATLGGGTAGAEAPPQPSPIHEFFGPLDARTCDLQCHLGATRLSSSLQAVSSKRAPRVLGCVVRQVRRSASTFVMASHERFRVCSKKGQSGMRSRSNGLGMCLVVSYIR